jgi:nicotinamide mononucleotide transporter
VTNFGIRRDFSDLRADMIERLGNIGFELLNTTPLEWIAVFSGLFYVLLIARKNSKGWFFAAVSSGIYIYLCFINDYFLESALQVFYLTMALYGWVTWQKTRNEVQFIRRWKLKYHLMNIVISTLLTVLLGFIFSSFTSQQLPYLDAFTTVFSIGATFMVTQKVLENWMYWIVIDILSIQLYAHRDLNLTAVLFALYTIIAVVGYFRWRKVFRLQQGA